MKKAVLYAAIIGACAVLTSSAAAQANPATSMSAIESSAAQLCGTIKRQSHRGRGDGGDEQPGQQRA